MCRPEEWLGWACALSALSGSALPGLAVFVSLDPPSPGIIPWGQPPCSPSPHRSLNFLARGDKYYLQFLSVVCCLPVETRVLGVGQGVDWPAGSPGISAVKDGDRKWGAQGLLRLRPAFSVLSTHSVPPYVLRWGAGLGLWLVPSRVLSRIPGVGGP